MIFLLLSPAYQLELIMVLSSYSLYGDTNTSREVLAILLSTSSVVEKLTLKKNEVLTCGKIGP